MNIQTALNRRLALTFAAVGAATAVVLWVTVPGSDSAYIAKITNPGNTVSTNPYFTCANANAATGLAAALAWPLDDPFTLGVAGTSRDVSGNNRAGAYTLTGVAYQQVTTLCPRDLTNGLDYGTILDGQSGFVHYDTAFPLTNTFTESIWFSTNTTRGGRLIGFGNSPITVSGQYDRMIWMTNAGNLVFAVFPNAYKTITTSSSYNDGRRHHALASLGASGMQLWVDGVLVASDPTTTSAQTYDANAMYLRVGYDNLATWPNQPTSYFFAGAVRFADYFTTQLTLAQVKALYTAGTGT